MTPFSRAGLAVLALGASLATVSPGAAQDVSREEFRELAARASRDDAAAAELRRIDAVEGQPVDLERALAGAEGEALVRRLSTLVGDGRASGGVDPGSARTDAREIVSERRFRGTDVPRPFRRLVEWLGGQLRPADAAVDRLAGWLPGGRSTLWTILGGLVVLLAALAASRVARRRAARAVAAAPDGGEAGVLDPALLERAAKDAEGRGDLEAAFRLLFRAGLLRLHSARAIVLRDSLTTGQVRRRLALPEFDRLAASFDEVAYGGRRPEAEEVDAFRRGWTTVLDEVGSR
jgi:hypothetical protein